MLPNKNRLARSGEIRNTLRKRQYSTRTPLLHIVAADNPAGVLRLAVAVKEVKSAVKRNRLKRLVKAAVLENIDKIGEKVDMVIFPKVGLLTEKVENIAKSIMQAIEKWPE